MPDEHRDPGTASGERARAQPGDLEQRLVAHATAVRRLAAALLRDRGAADDLAQEALLAAWTSPPREPRALGGYLQRTVRRLAWRRHREDDRRTRRETAAARPEKQPAAADLAARAEALQAVSAAVAALPPALREVVLLRYHDDLPPRAIAARLGLGGEAVESRLRRARERIGAALGARFPDSSGTPALLALVAPWGGRAGEVVATAATTTMATKGKTVLAAAAALLLLGAGALWWSSARAEGDGPPRPSGIAAVPPAPAGPGPMAASVDDRSALAAAENSATATGASEGAAWTLRLTGRVVDARRLPVEGAEVTAQTCGGRVRRGTTGPGGRFELALGTDSPWACTGEVVAARDGQVGAGTFHVAAGRDLLDLGTVALASAGDLRVDVARGGRPEAGAEVVLRRVDRRAGVRWTATTDARGTAQFAGLPAERVCVAVTAADGATAVAVADVAGRQRRECAVELGAGAAVVCSAHTADGEPAAAVSLRVLASVRLEGAMEAEVPLHEVLNLPRTGDDGRAVLAGIAATMPLRVGVAAPWSAEFATVAGGTPGVERQVSLAVRPAEAACWRLVADGVTLPADGSVFRIGVLPDRAVATAVLADGTLTVADPAALHARDPASSPDLRAWGPGCAARLPSPGVAAAPAEARLRPTHRLVVGLRSAAGLPLAGMRIEAVFAADVSESATTDARGRAVFDDRAGRVSVRVVGASTRRTSGGSPIGSVDLDAGDQRLDVALGMPRPVRARVFVDGEPGLPGALHLASNDGVVTDLVEDPAAGELEFRFWPREQDGHGRLLLYGSWRQSTGVADLDAGTGPALVTFELQRHGAATIDLVLPADGLVQVFVERLTGDLPHQRSIWTHVQAGPGFDLPRMSNLRPGRYRLRDALSDVAGPVVEVDAGTGDAVLTLDLSRVVALAGRVVADGGAPASVTVELRTVSGSVVQRAPVGADGTFSLRAALARDDLVLVAKSDERESAPVPVVCAMRDLQVLLPR